VTTSDEGRASPASTSHDPRRLSNDQQAVAEDEPRWRPLDLSTLVDSSFTSHDF
jgi:hypothetical protein